MAAAAGARTCTEDEIDSYFMLPRETGMHGEDCGKGWSKSPDADLLDLQRQPMPELEPQERIDNFDEIVHGYDRQRAIIEASRCVQCGMCHDSCPTHMHAPDTNPFSHTCGRVCTHRCESACSIGRRGEPIAIRWLKRYAMDAVPQQRIEEIAAEHKSDSATGRKVAIVGSGPSGLTAAFDLVKQGHQVVVYEALEKPGGMIRYGIPDYRLPQEVLDREIGVITSLGVEIRCNTRVGGDITMEQLHDRHRSGPW